MGLNVLSLFDGMSCGHIALEKIGAIVDNYVASEVKNFAIEHTKKNFPDTIEAGDVTKLHFEMENDETGEGILYRDCRRWCLGDASVFKRARKNKKGVVVDDYLVNKNNIKEVVDNGLTYTYIDVVNLVFESDFDSNNAVLADYKDAGLVFNARTLNDEELENWKVDHKILPNGEIAIWEFGEPIFNGSFDMLIGGSPCQDFSVASSTNTGKYGLEGSKSRLLFDFLRLKEETSPKYFFLENVRIKEPHRSMISAFLGYDPIHINSVTYSIQNRDRLYWTNLTDVAPVSAKTNDEINFQNFKMMTLPRLEWALYLKKFPGSYYGYASDTQEYKKGGFEFDETRTDDTPKFVNFKTGEVIYQDGTKEEFRDVLTDENGNFNTSCDFTDEEAVEIAFMNRMYREDLESWVGHPLSDREFVNYIHEQLEESLVKKSPSRDNMRYGKYDYDENGNIKLASDGTPIIRNRCHNITNTTHYQCLTRKQDRHPNSGLIGFGPYCRFLTKLEICKGQNVPYKYLGDLSYMNVQDVCGDGWTIDVVADFFKFAALNAEPVMPYIDIREASITPVESIRKKNTKSLIDTDDESLEVVEETSPEIENEPITVEDVRELVDSVMEEVDAKVESKLTPPTNAKTKKDKIKNVQENPFFVVARKHCDDKTYAKIVIDYLEWGTIRKMSPYEVGFEVWRYIYNECREQVINAVPGGFDKEKMEWCTKEFYFSDRRDNLFYE